jgi:hypothetical protein
MHAAANRACGSGRRYRRSAPPVLGRSISDEQILRAFESARDSVVGADFPDDNARSESVGTRIDVRSVVKVRRTSIIPPSGTHVLRMCV